VVLQRRHLLTPGREGPSAAETQEPSAGSQSPSKTLRTVYSARTDKGKAQAAKSTGSGTLVTGATVRDSHQSVMRSLHRTDRGIHEL
jgi:pyruvate carboxylase